MILFFGPAGSGKSTQAKMIASDTSWRWLSMGQMLRNTDDNDVHAILKKGELVPIETVNKVLDSVLVHLKSNEKVILDGYPRQIDQAAWFIDECKRHDISVDLAINFEVHMEELLARIKLRGRSDDTKESINRRIAIYHAEIDPILNLLSNNNIKVVSVDGIGTPKEIHERVKEELSKCKLM